jgi:hypothetical protein
LAPEGARAEDPQRHERGARARLADDEPDEQRQRQREQPERLRRAPAVLGRRLDDRVDGEHEAARDEHRARDVGALADPDALVARDEPLRQDRGEDPDRHVDEEDPVVVDRLREHAAGQQTDRAARGGDEAIDPDRLRLLARLGEHREDHPEDDRGGHRAADALDEAGRDERLLAPGDAAQQRREREDAEAGHEDALAPEQVAEAPGEQEQAAEGDEVGVDDPGKARLGEAEVVLDRR